MNSFWSLVGYEYKKILHKKSVRVVLLLAVIVSAFSVGGTLFGNSYVDGEVFESNYDAMVKDRAYARALAGRKLDGKLIMEAVSAYVEIPQTDKYSDTVEYQTIARPYSEIYLISRTIFDTASRRFNMGDFQALTDEQVKQFYVTRRDKQVQLVEGTGMSNKAKEQMLALDAQIETPFTFSYTGGYTRFFVIMYTCGLAAAFVMAICVAPLFSGEYTLGADQLILASKHGKNRLIAAKLFTGFSLAAAICLALTAAGYAFSMCIFGFDGGEAPLQLLYALVALPTDHGASGAASRSLHLFRLPDDIGNYHAAFRKAKIAFRCNYTCWPIVDCSNVCLYLRSKYRTAQSVPYPPNKYDGILGRDRWYPIRAFRTGGQAILVSASVCGWGKCITCAICIPCFQKSSDCLNQVPIAVILFKQFMPFGIVFCNY